MPPDEQQLSAIAEAVVRYLNGHPDAADTVDGIATWWLPMRWRVDPSTVQAALARLEAQGAVHRRTLADRHVLYSR